MTPLLMQIKTSDGKAGIMNRKLSGTVRKVRSSHGINAGSFVEMGHSIASKVCLLCLNNEQETTSAVQVYSYGFLYYSL